MKVRSLVLGLLFTAACGDPPQTARPSVEVSDSAGVRILDLGGPLSAAAPLGVTELWTHGHGPEDYPFQWIIAGAVMSDGSSVLADTGGEEVVAISEERGYEVLMRSGEGPAEVRRPSALHSDGTSLWVEDDGNGRLVLLEGGSVARTVSTLGRLDLSYGLRLRGIASSGDLLMSTGAFPPEFEGRWRMADLVALDPDDLAVDSIAQYRIADAAFGSKMDPFLPYGVSTALKDGWAVGWMGTPEVHVLDERGEVRRIVRWQPELRYPDQGWLERFEESLRVDTRRVNRRLTDSELERVIADQIARLEVDAERPLPLFREIIGDDSGRIWIETYEASSLPVTLFTVVRPEDGAIRSVRFPTPVRVLDVRGDNVLAVVTSDLDVQAVSLFRVDPFGEGEE